MAPSSSTPMSLEGRKPQAAPARIAVGIDDHPSGMDAAVLGSAIAAAGADLLLVSVHPDPLVVMPGSMSWKGLHTQARDHLAEVRDAHAPRAGLLVETDTSVARGLERAMRGERRDLLVVGSSPRARDGHVGIGKRSRQLLGHASSPLAIAPRGLRERPGFAIKRIGVGYDGGPESAAALELAAAMAQALGAGLTVRLAVDDRIPVPGWSKLSEAALAGWTEAVAGAVKAMQARLADATAHCGAPAEGEVVTGRPADTLAALCDEIDLLVIGARRWGPISRLIVGTTGEAMLHEATCPLLLVPRPPEPAKQSSGSKPAKQSSGSEPAK
jgi:nucleotide-binding universal stress UspA family protein